MIGLSVMSALRRAGLVSDWSPWSSILLRMNQWLRALPGRSSSDGGMMVRMVGSTGAGGREGGREELRRGTWGIFASEKTGPEVPCTPAVVLTKKLHYGNVSMLAAGARPCVGAFTLEELSACVEEEMIDLQQYVHWERLDSSLGVAGSTRSAVHLQGQRESVELHDLGDMSPVVATMPWHTQRTLSPMISHVLNKGGVAIGNLRVVINNDTWIQRCAPYLLRDIFPGSTTESNTYRSVLELYGSAWKRCVAANERAWQQRSNFSMLPQNNILVEWMLGAVKCDFVQKKISRTSSKYPIVNIVAMVPIKMTLFGYLPLPVFFAREILPHKDGAGWDVTEVLSAKPGGTILQTQASYRIVSVASSPHGHTCPSIDSLDNMTKEGLQASVRALYNMPSFHIPEDAVLKDWMKVHYPVFL